MTEAAVVGSGPNGLAAAVVLARAGLAVTVYETSERIGGGARSSELTEPGLVHDDCSAFHPTGAASPLLRSLGLERYGLRWRWPEIDLAHPLDGGRAALLSRSMDTTERALGADGAAWRGLFEPLADGFDELFAELTRPMPHLPRHPVRVARFGSRAVLPATGLARRWGTVEARALFAGIAAHPLQSLSAPLSAAIGLMLTAAGHAYGWPVAEGGSQALPDALAALLREHGGVIKTGVRIESLAELAPADLVLLDVAPPAARQIIGDRLPGPVARAYRRHRFGPAAYKLDLAVAGGIPWTNEHCARAGTVHLGGTLEEIAHAEAEAIAGRMPASPFMLLGQQYLADPGRSRDDVHPVWAYAHVPHGYTGDASEAMITQIERFAPGVRERIVRRFVRSATEMPRYNPNYVGGDIAAGSNQGLRQVFRPRIAMDPYSTGVDGVYLCSSATPPGAGAHGMCGYNAAQSALRYLNVAS